MPVWLGTQQKTMSFLAIFKKTHFRITIPIRGCSSFMWCKAWRHESEYVKTMYLDAVEILICSRALMIAQISAVNTDAESGNLMEPQSQHFHPVNHLYKQECDHGTCLVFPWKAAGILMHLFDLFSDAPIPAQSSEVWHTKVVSWNMKVFPKCQKAQCWKQLKTAWYEGQKYVLHLACIKQLHIFIIKHRLMCRMFWQWLYLGSILQR